MFGCSNNKDSQTGQNELQDDIGNPIVYLGNEDSPNEILFIFDYECPYCHEWIEEHFSTMKNGLIMEILSFVHKVWHG